MQKNVLDNELLGKAKNGDIEAFETIITTYEKLYYNIAYRMIGNAEDAKDVTQDSLIKIYKNIHKCTNIESFKSWSGKIITNTCIDAIRSKKRKQTESIDEQIEGEEGAFDKQIDSKELSPEQKLIKNEDKKIILEAINDLPEKYRTILILRELNGLSYEEIADFTNNSLGTVKSRISRARNKLKDLLSDKLELRFEKNV